MKLPLAFDTASTLVRNKQQSQSSHTLLLQPSKAKNNKNLITFEGILEDFKITSSIIPKGLKTPAAIGIPRRLYMLAKRKFNRILLTVFLDKSRHATTSSKSFLISTTSAASAKFQKFKLTLSFKN